MDDGILSSDEINENTSLLDLEDIKKHFNIPDGVDYEDKLVRMAFTASQEVIHAIRFANPNFLIVKDTKFFFSAQNVAMINFEASKLRQIDLLIDKAVRVYDEQYKPALDELTRSTWADESPRRLHSTNWEEEHYRPIGQDFGVPIDYE